MKDSLYQLGRDFFLVTGLVCLILSNGGCLIGNQGDSDGGMGGTGVTAGPISSLQGLVVNGIKFDTSKASVEVNGQLGSRTMLNVGMVIRVRGVIDTVNNTGIAEQVDFNFNVIGAIDNISQSGISLVVVGQPVELREITEFNNSKLENLSVGDVIGVSGFVNADGVIVASYIESLSYNKTMIEGEISKLDVSRQTFQVQLQRVGYSPTTVINLGQDQLTDGQVVRIEGTESTLLAAARIEYANQALDVQENDIVITKGPVLDIAGSTSYLLGGVSVMADAQTVFIDGAQAEIELNTDLLVEGISDSGVGVIAKRIEFLIPSDVSINATVDSLDIENNVIRLFDTLEVVLPDDAIYLDNSSINKRIFSAQDVDIGNYVRILARKDGAILSAIRLERVDPGVKVELRGPTGPVSANPLLSILDINADTSGVDNLIGFTGAGGGPITRDTFFANLSPDCSARIAGQWSGTSLLAMSAQLLELSQSGMVDCTIPGPPDVPAIVSVNPVSGKTIQDIVALETQALDTVTVNTVQFGSPVFGQAVISRIGNTIYAEIPAGATTDVICMGTSIGQICSNEVFGISPTIDQFVPLASAVNTGITIYGSGYFDVTAVSFNGVPAAFSASGPNTLIVAVPVGATTGPITVTAASGISTTTSIDFTVQ